MRNHGFTKKNKKIECERKKEDEMKEELPPVHKWRAWREGRPACSTWRSKWSTTSTGRNIWKNEMIREVGERCNPALRMVLLYALLSHWLSFLHFQIVIPCFTKGKFCWKFSSNNFVSFWKTFYLTMKSYFEEASMAIMMTEDRQQSKTDANMISNDPLILLSRFPSVLMNAWRKANTSSKWFP